MKKIFLILVIGSSLLAVGVLLSSNQTAVELKFSHKLHVVEQEIACQSCHAGAEASAVGQDNLLPSMETCSECHDVEDENNCQLCHSDVENPRAVPRIETYSRKFSHKTHLQAGLDCNACHQQVLEKTSAFPVVLPNMKDCMNCHQQKQVFSTCQSCHMPDENLRPASHTANFIHSHSDLAQLGERAMSADMSCATCHQPDFCQECHEGDNLDRRTHPLNFAFTHALQAQGKERECAVCHTERQFCIDCHRDNLVLPHNHTAGWANRVDGGRHRMEAMNDLENCMACHEQNAEQICQPCHGK